MKKIMISLMAQLLMIGCEEPVKQSKTVYPIQGRSVLSPIYLITAPNSWEIETPTESVSKLDTRLPIVQFRITEFGETIKIVIHNFPSKTIEERIPPLAQIIRWKQQFETSDQIRVTPAAWGGYSGYCLECSGMMGWAMQIHPDHYYFLSSTRLPYPDKICKEMRADFTIKATGPEELLDKYREDITAFANSLELYREIFPLK